MRYVLRLSAHGLTDEQTRTQSTASSLCISGLIKHVAEVEGYWMDIVEQRPIEGSSEDYMEGFQPGPDETIEVLLERYEEAAKRTDSVVATTDDLGQAVPVPKDAPWFPKDVDAWSVRWVLLHLIEETARHAGHADIVREGVDGATAFPLMAAAEGWEPTPWMQPWEPAGAA
jgi:uncharacterized damage-inducible protein DinB